MPNNYMDSTLLDKAIIFATNAHKNTERRGKGFPYIVHPLEVLGIVATMTNDQELLAAAVLHDTIEDCDVTIEEIKKEFGDRVACIVKNETDATFENLSLAESWRQRKEIAIRTLKNSSIEAKMVAIGDKLSNIRAMARDFDEIGDKLWDRFHVNDHKEIEWYYRGLADSLHDLYKTWAYKEFVYLIDRVFLKAGDSLDIRIENNEVFFSGNFVRKHVNSLEEKLHKGVNYIFNFARVGSIDYGGLRELIRLKNNGYTFSIDNAIDDVAIKIYSAGIFSLVPVTEAPKEICMDDYEQSGDGFTAISYFCKDNDSMMKLYFPFISLQNIEVEKKRAFEAFALGVPTPIPGDIVKHNDQYGLTFERIMNKKSFARLLGEDNSRCDELAKIMSDYAHKLHKIECNTEVFSSEKAIIQKGILNFSSITSKEKERLIDWIDTNITNATTCLHGDFHMGNIIMTDKKDVLFIDMGDFAYGDPRFDIACFYFNTHIANEERLEKLYHTPAKVLREFYDRFLVHYYSLKTEKEFEEKKEEIQKIAALVIFFYAAKVNEEPWMSEMIHKWLINKI